MTPSPPLRVSAVSFLNGRVLYDALLGESAPRDELGNPLFAIRERLPGECAEDLAEGRCDLALVPVASAIAHPEWEVVPGIGIGCLGAVETVVLVAQVPLSSLTHVAVDGASRTSVLLLDLLLQAEGLAPTRARVPHGTGTSCVRESIGALVIGDAAFGLADQFPYVYDLGQEWFQRTRLPFVFAFWAARAGCVTPRHVEALQWARDRGLEKRVETIVGSYRRDRLAEGLTVLSENHYANYLRRRIHYDLGTPQREGLAEFLGQVRALGLAEFAGLGDDDEVHLRFVGLAIPENLRTARARPTRAMDCTRLLRGAADGERLDLAEGIHLLESADLLELARAADRVRARLHPDRRVTYIVDRNVNYTNLCVTRCKFCNFFVPPGHRDGYVLTKAQLAEKFAETEALGGVQILLQGGLNPALRLSYYEDLFRWSKANFDLALHALSPTEIIHIAQLEQLEIVEVLARLQAAGLDSIPGGGAEILDDEVRGRISPFKNTTAEWLEVMRSAHSLGMKTTATMVFGFQESAEQLVLHLDRLRHLQDETGGFTAFITWPFQAEGTRLKLRDDTSALRYLRIQALARVYLDNIPNLQVSWPTLGPAIGELALRFGANDFGSLMIEENVVSRAGAHFKMTTEAIEAHIRWAGFEPARRNMRYELVGARDPAAARSRRADPEARSG